MYRTYLVVIVLIFTLLCGKDINGQWTATSALPAGAIAYSIASSGGNTFVGTFGQGIFRSTNNGDSWLQVNTGLSNLQVWSILVLGNNVYAGTANGGLFISTNSGELWTALNSGIPATTTIKAITSFASKLYAATSNAGIHISENMGQSWTKYNTGISNLIGNCFVSVDTTLFAGVGAGRGVYRSGPNSTWSAANTGIPNNSINALLYKIVNNTGFLFAGTYGGGIARSADKGVQWTIVNTGLENNSVFSLAQGKGIVYAGNELGVYASTNDADQWTSYNEGLTGASPVTGLVVNGDYLFCIYKGGVWRRTISGTTAISEKNGMQKNLDFTMEQNYPNPFNPSTKITYAIPQTGNVSLRVFDILGKEAAVLVDGVQEAGRYEVVFSAVNLSSGVYVYRLESGAHHVTKKLSVLK